MADGVNLGDVFGAFFGDVSHQEIKLSDTVSVVITESGIKFKQKVVNGEGILTVDMTADQFKVLAELLLPNITQTTTINVAKVREKLTPIRKD